MKLSMWMIANRLSSVLDIKPEIKNGEPVLNSARLAYATNCVHVYQDGENVIYEGEGDRLHIIGSSVKEAFEILQGVFDFYQDWESQIQQDIKLNQFEELVEHCWIIFQNPMILQDANNQVLALTTGHDIGEMDPEWEYLTKYRYSSLSSINYMRNNQFFFDRPGHQFYKFKKNDTMNYGGISYTLQFGGITCGRLGILEKNRELNAGDSQLLEKIAEYVQPVLGIYSDASPSGYNVFYNLMMGKEYNERELLIQLTYRDWTMEDTYQLALLRPMDDHNLNISLTLLSRTLSQQMHDAVIFTQNNYVIIFSNKVLSQNSFFVNFIDSVCQRSNVKAGYSMTTKGPKHADALFRQAENALKYGQIYAPEDYHYHFYNYSIYYILETPNLADKIHASHPVIRKLWKLKKEQNDELYDTLKAYLDNEQSLSKTAAAVFTHRNTVLYRVKKCLEYLNDNLESPAIRYYIRLSMHYLEAADKINSMNNIPSKTP